MALKKCYECGKEISTEAESCPHCGAPQDKAHEQEKLKELLSKEAAQPGLASSVRESAKQRKQEQKKQSRTMLGCLGVIAVILIIVLYAFLSDNESGSPARSPRSDTVTPVRAPKKTSSHISLNAVVAYDGSQFSISNKDTFHWKDVKFEINYGLIKGGYSLKAAVIESGQTYTVGAMQFAKSDGTRLNPFVTKVQKMSIFCDSAQGRGSWFGAWE